MRTAILMLALTVSACTAVQQKGEAYRQAAERFGYPDKLQICYSREGDVLRGVEHRCFGEGCKLPSCDEVGQ